MWCARLQMKQRVTDIPHSSRNVLGPRSRCRSGSWATLRAAVTFLSLCFLFQISAGAQVKETRRVVFLSDLGVPASPGFTEVETAIFSGLEKSPYKIEFYEESLEITLFPDEASQRVFRENFIRKYSYRKPDVIVVAGSASLKFIAGLHEKFIQDTPIIFCAVLGELPNRTNPNLHFAGVLGSLHPEETLNAALHLLPGTKHVVVTGGVGPFDDMWEGIAKKSFQKYESSLDFTYLTDLAMPALLERLKHLPNHTIVYHTALTQDAAGDHFIDSAESAPLVVSAANAPVFVMDDVDFNAGAVGGDLVNWADDARVASEMAVRVLNGEKPEDIPIAKSKDAYMFDWRAMQRWGLEASALPPGSVVFNRPPSFWQLYKRYVLAGLFVILAQMLAIFALLWQRAKRRDTEMELALANEQFRLAVQAGKSVAWEVDIKSGRTRWFGDLPTMFGMNSETFVGQVEDFYHHVHPEDRRRVLEEILKSRENHEPYSAEFRILLPDGAIRWIDDRGEHKYARNGEPTRIFGMAVDITERKQMEEAVRKSEEKFSKAFRESPLGFTITSTNDHHYIEVNDTYEHITGWKRDEVIGRTPMDVGIWVEPNQRIEFIKRLVAEGSIRNHELSFRRRDGQVRTGLTSAELIEINGEACALSAIADITEPKKAEEKRQVSEHRFSQFFNTLPEYCFMTSANGEILDANPAACKVLGYSREELIGKSLSTIYALGSLSKMVDLLEKWHRTGTLHDEEMNIVTKGGQTRTVLLNAGSAKDANGNLLYSTTVLVDVTERQQAEAALRESEERFRLVANAAPVMIWMSGPDKLCNYFNQPWLNFTGRSIHAELGNGWAERVHPEDLAACLETYANAFDLREPFEMEYRLRRRDGEYRWLLDLGVPRFQQDGSFAGYIGSCLDVTDRKLAQEALGDMSRKLIEAQEQERTWIARELHDDINQRITLILVNLERLQGDSSPLTPAITQRIAEVKEHLSSLASDIQALSHHLHSSKLEYLGLVTAASSFCRELSSEHGVEIEFQSESVPRQLPQEVALCLFRVLQESLQNAVKHSGSKHFDVRLKGTANEINLTVRDSGAGFDPEEAMRGRGLGLTSMNERLKLVHGKLSVDSKPAQGTVIRAAVPLNVGAQAAHAGT